MGLDIMVGWLAQNRRCLADEEFRSLFEPFDSLNEVLVEGGAPPHHEPLDVADDDVFEAQMWGYNGLRMVRRVAAHWALEGRLPPPIAYDEVDEVPVLDQLYAAHNEFMARESSRGLLSRFAKSKPAPAFAQLLLHSDCEGFYLPRRMDRVIFDSGDPQREGVGYMVGSAPLLWEECQLLASCIDLPEGLDTQDEQLWEFADRPSKTGPLWQQYGVEAYCLTVLMRATEASARLGAAVQFV
ncbi:hypothetical protein [Blastomonas sp. AAP53]|uniref:hypothetical protein n=1 Tax=Blastomonas sp. AAP53 TaxID=1248760 RepID=UPI00037D4BBD|nr:hypothetical protein [Blastomonas sp. AAP53]